MPKEQKPAARFVGNEIAPRMVTIFLTELAHITRGRYAPVPYVFFLIDAMVPLVGFKRPWACIKAGTEFLLFQVVLPTLAYNKEDEESWREDPLEFSREKLDLSTDYMHPRVACIDLVQSLTDNRPKFVMPLILEYSAKALMVYQAAAPEARDYRTKDGLLRLLCAIAETLKDSPAFKPSAESFIMQHVLPETRSPVHFMRMRACYTIACFSWIEYSSIDVERAVR